MSKGSYCFSSFVIVLTPPTSLTVADTLSPGFTALNTSPSWTLKLLGGRGGIGTDGAALRLLNRNRSSGFIDLADRPGHALLRDGGGTRKK